MLGGIRLSPGPISAGFIGETTTHPAPLARWQVRGRQLRPLASRTGRLGL